MAKILLNFTHVPSVSQKETLQGILANNTTTVAERVVAEALMNVEHIASPYDRPKLEALIRDESAPAAVKTLAIIARAPPSPREGRIRRRQRLGGLLNYYDAAA